MTTTPIIDPIRLAVPSKGHLYEGVVEILKTAGYKVRRASDRQYEAVIAGQPRFHVVFMRPTDIVTQVEEGRCQLGVTGMDVFAETADESERSVVVIPDLGYGGCRLVVAVLLESGRSLDEAIALARGRGRPRGPSRVLAVSGKPGAPGSLRLVDAISGTDADVTPDALARLARDGAEERPR